MRDGIRVLYYHGVVERYRDQTLERNLTLLSEFRSQVRLLRRFAVLSAPELAAELSTPSRRRRPAALMTFDDGYANNLVAGEVLAAARLPWTLFVSTAALGRCRAIWPVELSLLLLHGGADRIEALGRRWPLSDRAAREAAFQAIRHPLKALASQPRIVEVNRIREQFPPGESERLLSEFPSLQMLSWEEVSELSGRGAEIGSHGVEHEIHHGRLEEGVRRRELADSKKEIEARLLRPCRFFAYPNGDFVPASPRELEEAGYELAFTTENGTWKTGINPYLIPRLEAGKTLSSLVKNFFWKREAADRFVPAGA